MNTTLKILALAIGLAAAGPWDLYANATSPTLFRASSAKINVANDRGYDDLLKSRRADSIVLVDINADAISANTDTFSLGLRGMNNIAYKLSSEKTPSGSIVWQGTFGKRTGAGDFLKQRLTGEIAVDPMNFIQVTRHKEAVVGSMRYNGESYELVPTEKGYAFIKVNPSFASHCGQHGNSDIGGAALRRGLASMTYLPQALDASTRATTVYTANVLFGITTDGLARIGGTAAKAIAVTDNMIAATNRVFANSGVSNARVQSAGIVFFANYNSSSAAGTDLGAIRTSTHADMVAFRAAKTRVKSDIAAVLGVYGTSVATVNPGSANFSNLVTSYNAGLLFTHEVGHIYGGDHQPGSGSVNPSYARAYFVSTGSYPFKTVMNSSVGSQTIEYFSNTRTRYQNQAMGSTTQRNADVVSSNAQRIAQLVN
jgi:Metallo-peptidase family M12